MTSQRSAAIRQRDLNSAASVASPVFHPFRVDADSSQTLYCFFIMGKKNHHGASRIRHALTLPSRTNKKPNQDCNP